MGTGTVDLVVSGPAEQVVGRFLAIQGVGAVTPVEEVRGISSQQFVVAPEADQDVLALVAVQVVRPVVALDGVVVLGAAGSLYFDELVGALTLGDAFSEIYDHSPRGA